MGFTVSVADSANHVAAHPTPSRSCCSRLAWFCHPEVWTSETEIVGSASGTQVETLTNTVTSDVAIASITTNDAAQFNQTTTCGASLGAGASCAITVTFTPAQTGPRSAVITIIDDTEGSPQSVYLSGVGLTPGPNATLSTSSLSFDTELVDTTSHPLSLLLNNYGTATLKVPASQPLRALPKPTTVFQVRHLARPAR